MCVRLDTSDYTPSFKINMLACVLVCLTKMEEVTLEIVKSQAQF